MDPSRRPLKIWIDLENSPHVFFFHPIIRRLEGMGHTVVVTARDFCNTLAIARAIGLKVQMVGAGYERDREQKAKTRTWSRRISKLMSFAEGEAFDLAASHCSRTQAPAAMRLGIPTFATTDYEYSDLRAFSGTRSFMVPAAVPVQVLEDAGIPRDRVRHYPGLKENVYLPHYRLDHGIRSALGISEDVILVTLRPASDTAHYGKGESRDLEEAILVQLCRFEDVQTLILPRTNRQRQRFSGRFAATPSVRVLPEVVDGPSLVAASDVVISGGGTMIREAAALGVPAVSYFDGTWSAVDRMLVKEGRLSAIATSNQAWQFRPIRKDRSLRPPKTESNLDLMVESICEIAGGGSSGAHGGSEPRTGGGTP